MFDRLSAIRSFGPKALISLVAVAALATTACGSTTTSGGGASATTTPSPLTSCTVASSDLVPSTTSAGTSPAAPGVSGKLAIDGSTALAPLFQQAAKEFQTANSSVQITITPNGSGTGLKDVAAGAVSIGMSDVFASEKLTADK